MSTSDCSRLRFPPSSLEEERMLITSPLLLRNSFLRQQRRKYNDNKTAPEKQTQAPPEREHSSKVLRWFRMHGFAAKEFDRDFKLRHKVVWNGDLQREGSERRPRYLRSALGVVEHLPRVNNLWSKCLFYSDRYPLPAIDGQVKLDWVPSPQACENSVSTCLLNPNSIPCLPSSDSKWIPCRRMPRLLLSTKAQGRRIQQGQPFLEQGRQLGLCAEISAEEGVLVSAARHKELAHGENLSGEGLPEGVSASAVSVKGQSSPKRSVRDRHGSFWCVRAVSPRPIVLAPKAIVF